MDDIKNRLEPGILATTEGFAASSAVSLKRIADAMERVANIAEVCGAGIYNADPMLDFAGQKWNRQA